MKKIILTIILLISISLFTDGIIESKSVSGIIIDNDTKEFLVGVKIDIDGQSVYTDLNGEFNITTTNDSIKIKSSYISYNNHESKFSSDDDIVIFMKQH